MDNKNAHNFNAKAGEMHYQYIKKHAAIYQENKEFMILEERQSIDFSQNKNYKIFSEFNLSKDWVHAGPIHLVFMT